jgi:hypothetical protein
MCSNCENVGNVHILKLKNYLLNVGNMEAGHNFKTGEGEVRLSFTTDQWVRMLEALDKFAKRSDTVAVVLLSEEGSDEIDGEAWFCQTCLEAFEWGQGRAHSEVLSTEEYEEGQDG